MHEAHSSNGKNWRLILTLVIVTVVIFIALPALWQWDKHDWNLNATFVDMFAGDIDWSAWWGFGTFLVAVGAALFAFYELASQQNEWSKEREERQKELWEQSRAVIQMSYRIQGSLIFIDITNAGKTTARDICISMDKSKEEMKKSVMKLAEGTREKRLLRSKWQCVPIDNEIENKIINGVLYRNRPFTSLAPGMKLTFLLGTYRDAVTDEVKKDIYQLSGTVSYLDHNSKKCPDELFKFDFSDMEDTAWPVDKLPCNVHSSEIE